MKRALASLTLLCSLAAAPQASAGVIELGEGATPSARASCPASGSTECQAVGRVTGYMGRSGSKTNPFIIPRAGKILAFTIALGNPTDKERAFFTDLYGGPPQVRISVLRAGRTRKTRLTHRLLRQSSRFRVERYFGSSPTFVFNRPLKVSRGNRIALTVPTWTPSLALGVGRANWWRSSRRRGSCSNVGQRAQQQSVNGTRNYGCTYFTARLTYSVSYVPDPRRTDGRR
ncbi:MAG: hypothetical protein M3433_05565 [Actinomycetota bacterium]|nr:hypothetical protein [Actinomycetota bacterium]